MNENLKRLLSFLIVAAMAISMMPITAGAEIVETVQTPQETVQQAPQQTAEADLPTVNKVEKEVQLPAMEETPVVGELLLDVQKDVYVEASSRARLSFTPSQSGSYIFQSKSNVDTYGYLYDSNGSILKSDDDGGSGSNFMISYTLEAGVTYYLEVRFYSNSSGIMPVICQQSPLVSLEFSPVSIVEKTNGYNSGSYYRYYESNILRKSTYTATFRDGTVLTGSDTELGYNDVWYTFNYSSEQASYNPWTVGNTYYVTVKVLGVEAQVPVSIVESPVKDVRVEPVIVRNNKDGYLSWGNGEEYFRYDWYEKLRYTVEFKDGTVKQGTYEQPVEYNGDRYGVESRSDDQNNVHWEVNNTYEATAKIAGMQVTVLVTVRNLEEDNGYQYLIQGDEVIIIGCRLQTQILQIPETLEGCPVTGIVSLGSALEYAKEIRIPDGVTMLSENFLCNGADVAVQKLTLGAGITLVSVGMLRDAVNLEQIQVAADNATLCSIDGVVYDKNATTLLLYPPAKQQQHKIPNTVTNADILLQPEWEYAQMFANANVELGAGISGYKLVDGVIYTADMKTVVRSTASATGDYVMPESVEQVMDNAFMNSNLTSVKISSKVTDIVYSMFSGAQIEEVTIPESVEYISECAFADCENLKKVNITDLEAWCDIWFDWVCAYPLAYGADLYVNGRLTRDLVIPGTVDTISANAFLGGSFTSVTIPASVESIGHDAFWNCDDLEKVYITDMAAWCGTLFGNETANPLVYARDLYLNGKLVKDLVIPETVADRVYADVTDAVYGVGKYAFVNASIESVILPEKIECIGYCAFEGCEDLTKVDVPSLETWCGISFQSVTANPLYHAGNLYVNGNQVKDVVIPDVVSAVYNYAFYGSNITSVTVPSSVYYINECAFYASSLERITFAEGLQGIGSDAFSESCLKSVDLPDSLEWIDSWAFAWCWDLESVTFGEGLYEIGWEAFACTSLKSVTLPDSLEWMGEYAFAWCTQLKELNLGKGVRNIYEYTFAGTALEKLTVPAQVQWIADWAFSESQLKEVTFLGEEVYVGGCAFNGCPLGSLELGENVIVEQMGFAGTSAVQISLPETATELTYREFAFNKNLVSVTIPDTVTEIGANVFEGDDNLSHVLYTGTQSQWNDVLCDSPEILSATLHCDAKGNEVTVRETCNQITYTCAICNKTETLQKAVPTHRFNAGEVCEVCGHDGRWEYTVNRAEGTVTITGYQSLDGYAEMPDTIEDLPVTAFTENTFAYNQSLYNVIIGANITRIPDNAFRSCEKLNWVYMGDSVTEIGDYAFYECYELFELEWSYNLESIGDYAFANSGVQYFPYQENLESLGIYAFYSTHLSEVELPEGLTEIESGVFEDCYSLQSVTLPETVTDIAYYAFCNSGISELTIPAGVEFLAPDSFGDCELEYVYFLGEKPVMDYAFGTSNAIAFHPDTESWEGIDQEALRWRACRTPEVVKLPLVVTAEEGEIAVATVEANGQRLSYQWLLAAPGSSTYDAVGGNSFELPLEMNAATTGSRAFCVITDVLGQSVKTETVTLKITPKLTGIALEQLPYTLEYDLRQELRTRGLEVVKTFSDDSTEPLTEGYTVTGYDPNKSGEQTITVTWENYTATFTVTVNAEKVSYTATTENQERIEISVPENAVEEGAELVVEKVELEDEEVTQIPEIIQQNESVVFDIFFEKGEQVVQPTEAVQVQIPVPADMESKRCKVFHVKDDGTSQDMNAVYKDGHLVFETDHFSYYAVVQMTGVDVSGQVSGADTNGAFVQLIAGGEVLETVNVDNGTYCFKNVVDNDYVIRVLKDGRAPKDYELTVGLENVLLDVLLAILGDIDGDETVTTDDVIQLLLHVSMPEMFPIDAEADFIKDGVITTDDVIQLLLHVSMPEMFPLA